MIVLRPTSPGWGWDFRTQGGVANAGWGNFSQGGVITLFRTMGRAAANNIQVTPIYQVETYPVVPILI